MEDPAQQELPVPERGTGETPHLAIQQRIHQCPQQEFPHLWIHPRHEPLWRYGQLLATYTTAHKVELEMRPKFIMIITAKFSLF